MRAKRVMKFSVRAFFSLAFSTSSRTRATVDSPKGLVVRTWMRPVMLMQPLMMSSPDLAGRGIDSPVRAAVSSWVSPSTMTPSIGTRSPGLTTITVPTAMSSGKTCSSVPSGCSTLA